MSLAPNASEKRYTKCLKKHFSENLVDIEDMKGRNLSKA